MTFHSNLAEKLDKIFQRKYLAEKSKYHRVYLGVLVKQRVLSENAHERFVKTVKDIIEELEKLIKE